MRYLYFFISIWQSKCLLVNEKIFLEEGRLRVLAQEEEVEKSHALELGLVLTY